MAPAVLATPNATGSGRRTGDGLRSWWRGGIALVAAAILWIGAASPALALQLLVDRQDDDGSVQTCDAIPNNDNCTLRGAILRANAVPGPHIITVPTGTYTLTTPGATDDAGLTGDLDILQDITINGAGAVTAAEGGTVITGDTTIPVDQRDRIFHVLPEGSLTVHDLSIRAGGYGDTRYYGRGGGVWAQGPLTMARVSVRLNRQKIYGGGVTTEATTLISDSTINGNNAVFGAGIAIMGFSPHTVLIRNTTISANGNAVSGPDQSESGGIFFAVGDPNIVATFSNVTIANNAGLFPSGVYSDHDPQGNHVGSLIFRNTIVASNISSHGGGNCIGPIISQGHNLIYDPGGVGDCGFTDGVNGDIVNNGDPKLGDISGGNGGPTATHALRAGSAALDKGDPAPPGSSGTACEPNDQRGVPRTIDGDGDGIAHCDIGAAEGGVWYAVNTAIDSNDASFKACDVGLVPWKCSLRGAISNANAAEAATPGTAAVITLPARGADSLYQFAPGGAGEDLNVSGDLDIRSDVTIAGGGAATTIIDGNASDRVFQVASSPAAARLRLQDLTVQNGNPGIADGGGIHAAHGLSLLRVRVRANTAQSGGGIFFLSTDGVITDSTIAGNTITPGGRAGGGIHQSTGGTVTVTNSTIADNQGGGLLQFGGGGVVTNLRNVTIAGNGGGGVTQTGTVYVVNSIIAGNTVTGGGAALNCSGNNTPISQGFNLVFGGGTCAFTQITDRQNQDPKLQPLGFYGGPTETMALGAQSAAVDAGNPAAPTGLGTTCAAADQRGTARAVDGDLLNGPQCDIGAYEAPPCTLRGPVRVAITRPTSGVLQVTVTRGAGTVSVLQFRAVGSSNVLVDLPGQPQGQSGTFAYTAPGGSESVTFALRRASGTGAATAAFDVVDGCGPWRTLAGGGTAAWGAGSGPLSGSSEAPPAPIPAMPSAPTSAAPTPTPEPRLEPDTAAMP